MTGLQAFYDGDFDQWMEEAGSATKEHIVPRIVLHPRRAKHQRQ